MVAKVMRSRRSCKNSLRSIAPARRQKPPAPMRDSASMEDTLMGNILGACHQIDEDIFQRWRAALPIEAWPLAKRCNRLLERCAVVPGNVQARPECRNHVDAGPVFKFIGK